MAAPFEHAFDEHHKLQEEASKFTSEEAPQGVREGGEVMAIHYRDEEAIYIKAGPDRVTVIFSTIFREETDRVFGKVFIQEFVDARRRAIQNAPQVLFRTEPPLELMGVPGVKDSGNGEIGYVTFGRSSTSDLLMIVDSLLNSPVPAALNAAAPRRSHIAHSNIP
jgi:actin related protein 2/3 complex subunit 2